MIILFFTISTIVALIFGISAIKYPNKKIRDEYDYKVYNPVMVWMCIGLGCFVLLSVIFLITIAMLTTSIATQSTIDNKIAMYQEENAKIEKDIDTLVKNYMEHEKDTFSNVKAESSITLVNLYPELKSDKLVQEQIDIYLDNNNNIKELKEEKIEIKKKKFILYFGS